MFEFDIFEEIRFIKSSELEALVHQMKIDPEKFREDIFKIEQELLIRTLTFCRPVVDLL